MEPSLRSNVNHAQNFQKTSAVNSKKDLNWKWPTAGKENAIPATKSKTVPTTIQAQQTIKDVKANACKTFSNIKTTFDNISQRLRRSTRKRSNPSPQQYEELDNKVTPVKLYSPFFIETPSPRKGIATIKNRKHVTPKKFKFVSPTAKLKQDIDDLSNGMRELHAVAKSLRYKK